MSSQGTLFAPLGPTRTETPTIQARLISHSQGHATERAAAEYTVHAQTIGGEIALIMLLLRTHGPQTCVEMGERTEDPSRWRVTFAKRMKAMTFRGLVRVQQDPTLPCRCTPLDPVCRCHDVTRGGSRVWEEIE
jgi:hypothetical protein